MPTNQEWLHKLANESPDELKAWFDAEHVDDDGVSRSNDGVVAEHEADSTSNKSGENVTDYRDEVDRLQRRNDELRTSYDKLKRERDNLADDLLTCNREREQLRKHLGIALDHAHDICSLVDIDGNVLDVGD